MRENDLQNNTTTEDQQQAEQYSDLLDDLTLIDKELDGVKGGCGPFHKDDPKGLAGGGGGFINNHNEIVVSDEDTAPTLLADLETPNAGEIKGGPLDAGRVRLSTSSGVQNQNGPSSSAGNFRLTFNGETTSPV